MGSYVQTLVERSRKAQEILATYDQAKTDEIVKMFAKVVFDHAEPLAKLAVEESRMGVYEDKILKNKGKSRIIWNAMKGRKSVGIIGRDEEAGIIEMAKPMGIIAAATPCTNPVVTPMCNAMFAIKCQNTIIIAPHPRGRKCAAAVADLYYKELDRMGVPRDIFLVMEEPSVELTTELMAACDAVIATGGMAMVKSAYSSGKPSYGVGPGNVQGLIDEGINYKEAAGRMIASRIFDNGIICSGTQSIIAPEKDYEKIMKEFEDQGAYVIDDPNVTSKLAEVVFPGGTISKYVVGQSVQAIAGMAGISIPEDRKVIVVKPETYGAGIVWSKEKMCPIMAAYSYKTWEEAVEIAYQNLLVEGEGHSADIQSDNRGHIEYAGVKLPVSRVMVNQTSSSMAGGAFANSLNPTTTLGCGSWGNNAISENLFFTHLMNKSRIVLVKKNWKQPSDEEIFL
ncbi:aldehyde dehydrogenase family protein [Lacrimispora sphenoides]|uniref:Succinate-semialdehyde dehydrogenase n=1 Tax=Lacrimispora sphenoides JCM 1415 TaxID=1297793 RepID=A0ABY1CC47_9FIRM|nr:aldehyde dehydrogenase family protein [Lacrimispora sphenoides]SET89649.1 succinate-semialdehyde dehydrogenase [[Clostridium] sphenoides JCM 1415]SUY52148.1 succinate-semialdehyde dehydrogenase [Lacrimispora sphenoides]